jgi:hypothetical protein
VADEPEDEEPDEGDGEAYTRDMLTQTKIEALTMSQRARTGVSPRSKPRTPWSVRDETQLVNLISQYGCSWSLIQKKCNFADRDLPDDLKGQVALKDKARNLKIVWLK